MEDIKALSLVRQEIQNAQGLSIFPGKFEDEKHRNDFAKNCTFIIDHAAATITPIAEYAVEINKNLKQLRVTLVNSTNTVQERLRETLNSITTTSSKRENEGMSNSVGITLKFSSTENTDAKKMELALQLQHIEKAKLKLQKSIALTEQLWNDIDTDMVATMTAVNSLKGSINDWMTAENDKEKEDQRKRDKSRQKSATGEQRRKEADDIKRRLKEEEEQNKEDQRRRRKNKERKMQDEQRLLEDEKKQRRIQEEEDKNKKIEEERIQAAEEERLRKEEEDLKSRYEKERRLKEEEERRQREDEYARQMKEKEEERKRKMKEKQKREEEERLRKREEERKRIEQENLRRDPANWTPITYRYEQHEKQANAYHRGVYCHVAAMDKTLDEEDLECHASDEWREEDKSSVLNINEKLASSTISINAKTGEKIFPVPMRVYVPHCSISDSSDEIVVKMSIDGGEWTEQRPVSVPTAQIGHLGLNCAGIDVSKFKNVKMVAVAKTRCQEFVVAQDATNTVSTVDKNIKLVVPRDTFSKPCKLKLQVRRINDDSLKFATQYYEHCHNVVSTSSVITITSETATNKSIELDLARNARNDKRSRETGKYHHLYKCRGDSWKIADSEFKGRNLDVSVTLPNRKESYVVMEIEGRPTIPNDVVIKAADELYFHSNASIVQLIAKQNVDNQELMMIQCVGRERVASRISELEKEGYSLGPGTSKEFSLIDGQGITLNCSGNITMAKGSKVKLTFHSYMDTAKQEVQLQVVDAFRQKDFDYYLGNLQFEVMPNERDGSLYNGYKGSLPLTFPKVEREQNRKDRIQIHFPYYLTALAKFLAIRLTTEPTDDTWLQVICSLDSRQDMDAIMRRDVASSETPDNDQKICEFILQDWMKNTPVQVDKVKLIVGALRNCGRRPLAKECEKFVDFHIKELSDSRMAEMAKKMEGDWASLALTIGLSEKEIDMCRQESGDSNEETAFIMMRKWRISEVAITSGFDVFNDLLERLENSQSNMGLKKYISQVLIQIKL